MLAISISRAARSSLLATRRTFTSVNLASIKELRAKTSAPVSDCKKALDASDGDIDGAFDWLRQRGAAKASDLEKSGREANEGLVAVSLRMITKLPSCKLPVKQTSYRATILSKLSFTKLRRLPSINAFRHRQPLEFMM